MINLRDRGGKRDRNNDKKSKACEDWLFPEYPI